MASSPTKVIGVRVSLALAEKWEGEALALGVPVSGLIVADKESLAGLRAERDAALARIVELEKEVGRLLHPVNKAITTLAQLRSDPAMKAIDPKVHHVSGPVLTDPVPRDVAGQVEWFGLKGQDKVKGKAKP